MSQPSNKSIYQLIPLIMADVEPVAKSQKNTQQGYSFRGIDQVYAALQAILAKHGVFTVPRVINERAEERTSRSGTALIYRVLTIEYDFYAPDGSYITACVIGEGQDSGDKASNKAMSVAHKYALLQVFCIPTEEPKDPEHDSHELKPKASKIYAPKPVETYQAHEAQNKYLRTIFEDNGVTDETVMRNIAGKLIGSPMAIIAARIKKELNV